MTECITQTKSYEDLDQEVVFEVTENIKVTKQLKYKKDDMISSLMIEINKLKEQVQKMEQKNKLFIQEESLNKLWDNEDDDRWNTV